ncbi:MAG: hypothetical protein KC615_04905 [Anaerolineae bacterium]|nr:hypothetical protein [Anaerolineae bacterium]
MAKLNKKLLMLVCLLVLLIVSSVSAQDTEPGQALLDQFDALETFTQQTRGLDEIGTFNIVFPTRDDLAIYLENVMTEQLNSEYVAEAMAFYSAFDFLPRDYDIVGAYNELYMAQIAGFYDTETKNMNVLLLTSEELGDKLPLLEQIIYVHEYTHTLQDMNFDLDAYMGELADLSYDEALARQALVEGDATYVMSLFTMFAAQSNPLGASLQLLLSGAQTGTLSLPSDTPEILGAELLFPYEEGQNFVSEIYDELGWGGVNSAFANPPASTEQILHPEKYLANELPATIALPDVSSELGEGWQIISQGRMGEFYLQQYLLTVLRGSVARPAAAGWGTDALAIYVSDTGGQAWVLHLEWDTPEDEAEFRAAYEEFAAERYSEALSNGCWADDTRVTCMTESGTTLATAPTLDMTLLLLQHGDA